MGQTPQVAQRKCKAKGCFAVQKMEVPQSLLTIYKLYSTYGTAQWATPLP